MGKLLVLCLNVFISSILISQVSRIDSLLARAQYEKDAWNYFVDCLDRNNCNNQFTDGFAKCADSAYLKYPTYSSPFRLKCNRYIKTGDYKNYIKVVDSAVKIEKKEYGRIPYFDFYELKDIRRALNGLCVYDAFTPNAVDIVMNDNILSLYGLCYSEMGKLDSALLYFDSLIDVGTDGRNKFFVTLHDYTNRGVVHLKLGNYQKAKKDFQSTIREYSQSVEGHYYLALAKFHLGEDVNEIEPLLKMALRSYDKGLRNNHPYGEYVDLPNAVWRSDIMELYYKIKGVKTYHLFSALGHPRNFC